MSDDKVGVKLPNGWGEVLDKLDEKHGDAHDRLRSDLRALEVRLNSNYRHFEDQITLVRGRMNEVAQLAATPVDATKLVLSTKAIVALVIAAVGVSASFWVLRDAVQSQNKDIVLLQKTVERLEQSRIDDKREAQQRLSDFLNQRLENALVTQGAAKGAKK